MNAQFLQSIRANALGPTARAHIDLSNSLLRPRDLENFVKAIQKNIAKNPEILCPILTINMTGNEICGVDRLDEGEFDHRGLKLLATTLVQRSKVFKLRKLTLSGNRLDKRGFGLVATLLAGNHSITDIFLRDCGADDECIEAFIDSIEKSKGLVNVDLSFNPLELRGATFISRQLRSLKRLKSLDLSSCRFGAAGIRLICEGMVGNSTIQVLILLNNEAGDEGAAAIGIMLRENSSLAHLDIQSNKISSVGACLIGDGLMGNKTLIGLGLQWNDIGPQGGQHIATCIRDNTTLKSLYVFGNRIDEETAGILVSSPVGGPLDIDVKYKPMPRRREASPIAAEMQSPSPLPIDEEES